MMSTLRTRTGRRECADYIRSNTCDCDTTGCIFTDHDEFKRFMFYVDIPVKLQDWDVYSEKFRLNISAPDISMSKCELFRLGYKTYLMVDRFSKQNETNKREHQSTEDSNLAVTSLAWQKYKELKRSRNLNEKLATRLSKETQLLKDKIKETKRLKKTIKKLRRVIA